jgi:hypothetical protein
MYANVTDESKPALRRFQAKHFRVVVGRRNPSGVLLGAEVALIFDSFRAHAALVVLAIGRDVGCNSVLSGGVVTYLRFP